MSKNVQNFHLLGGLEIRGYEKLRFLLQKAHPCVNVRRLSHFASNRLRGLTPRAEIEKSQKITPESHTNDVSPLTQGLRYRAACDLATIAVRARYVLDIKHKKLTSLQHRVRATKSHIQNSTNHFSGIM